MIIINIDKETVGKTIKNVCNWAAITAVVVLPRLGTVKRNIDAVRYQCGNVTYSDAVGEVLNSSMWSTDKTKVTSNLPKDADPELYKSVIQVVRSSMYSGDKVEVIEHICGVEMES